MHDTRTAEDVASVVARPALRPEAMAAGESGIVEVFNYGRGRQGLIPLWVGEGDLPTPAFICDAATRSLAAGETFYTHQRGIPELRDAIARYVGRVYGAAVGPERFNATIGGMQALQIAVRMIAGSGDEVILPTPAWPNFHGALSVAGAQPVELPLIYDTSSGSPVWRFDLDRLVAAIGPRTRAIIVNSPANPTGWTATREEIVAILEIARRFGLWLIADEIYGRIVFDRERAPSFRDVMEAEDRIFFVQTLSKNWSMTGWRVGWLEAPPEYAQIIENLVQYSTSGVPVFAQRAAVAALDQGEGFFAHLLARVRRSRDIICDGLASTGRVHFAKPEGAFYLFCTIDGEADTRALALRLVDEAGVGVAPGSAFGRGGEDFLRICFARKPEDMAEATRRLVDWLAR
jgi:aspartate/methionine/tyrosine aminotransferase